MKIITIFITSVILALCIGISASASATQELSLPPDGISSGTIPPGNLPPGGGSNSANYTLSGVLTVDGKNIAESDKTYTSDKTDVSAIYATNGGVVSLTDPTIRTSGNTSSSDASSFYGLNGAILANNGSTITVTGGSIITTGSGANGAIPTGAGTLINLSDLTITASGDGGHGVMATLGGFLSLTDVDITTTGAHGAPIATDRGSGTVNVTRGNIFSSGSDSPGVYSTGKITVNDAVITSYGTEAAVIEGFNSIDLENTTLSGGVEKTGGTMIYQSFSGDAETGTGIFTMTGGSYDATEGPAFFVTNTDAVIRLSDVNLTAGSDILVKAAGTARWGTEGNNGGIVAFTADHEVLTGSLITDEISSINATLQNGSSLTGAVETAGLTLDSTSTWNVTGNSTLTFLTDSDGLTGGAFTNLIGNGFTVTYDPARAENTWLGGRVYPLINGGMITPQ